jgi:pimeloyl-ACP methyl ester carboxylesterase
VTAEAARAGSPPGRQPAGGSPVERVEVAGLRIAFRRAGSGPPLVLVHGAVCDGRVWLRQIAELSDAFSVIAWDAPGCGQSVDPPETYRLADYADVLAGFIGELGLRRPHVVGHSFGSGLAIELYRRNPGIAATLILVGAYAGWAGSLPRPEVERRLSFALELADRLPDRFEPASMRGLFSEAMPAETAAELATIMSDARPVATRAMAYAFAESDLRDALPSIDVPTLLLYGDVDERSPPSVAEALHGAIRDSRLVALPGLGHECYLEAPERFDAEVRAFLRSLS